MKYMKCLPPIQFNASLQVLMNIFEISVKKQSHGSDAVDAFLAPRKPRPHQSWVGVEHRKQDRKHVDCTIRVEKHENEC